MSAVHRERGRKTIETAAPTRNFSLPVADRIRALAAGPPAYALRKRRIEDLLDAMIAKVLERCGSHATHAEALSVCKTIDLKEINRLIETHNRYYPMEANLPIHPGTGVLLERGRPWKPLDALTHTALAALAIGGSRTEADER